MTIQPMYPRPYTVVSRAFLAYFRYELPGWGILLRQLKINDIARRDDWKNAPIRIIKGKLHRYRMRLDLSNWSERLTYFLGRYYDLELQLLLAASLHPGDRMLDVGGNIGMISLLASRLVGPEGQVDCFEPNPACVDRIKDVLRLNAIGNVRLHPIGLSDREGHLTLNVVTEHTGMGTLADVRASEEDLVSARYTVPVRVGDSLVAEDPRPARLIKIDVEGFELRVLNGLKRTLAKDRPMVIMEMVESHLARAGASVDQISGLMSSLGYRAYGITSARRFARHGLKLIPVSVESCLSELPNWVWLHAADPFPAGRYA